MVPIFIELCAGTAALSLRLHGGKRARPPVSRMGAKTGYASAILRTLGLRSGEGAGHYLWCEPDAGCRLLLTAYTDEQLRREAAEVIRGWKDEPPRELWERLRAEGPVTAPDPREVARWCLMANCSMRADPSQGYAVGDGCNTRWGGGTPQSSTSGRLLSTPTLPATITDDARLLTPPSLPPGSIAYIDPPYQNTTGYAADLSRAEVIELAKRWSDAGAWVVISEAEPIEALDWHTVEITGERVGQARTFSKQKSEWLTMSKPPLWRPSVQGTLFSTAAK